MTPKTTVSLVIAGALLVGAGCKSEDTTPTTDTPPPPVETVPSGAVAKGDEVASYPNMVPQGGTKRTLQTFTVYQAADPSSKVLTRVGPNTFINLKASYGNWMLIEWPSGVGQLSPGWIELRANDNRVTNADPPDGGAPKDAGSSTDAGTDAGATDAGATDAGATDAGATDAGATDGGKVVRPRVPLKPRTK